MDVFPQYSRVYQLAAIGFDQVQKDACRQLAVARSAGREEQQRVFFADGIRFLDLAEEISGVGELGLEVVSYFCAHLVAAAMDPRADGSSNVPGPGTEATAHFTDPLLDDSVDCPAPAGMKNAHRAMFGIDKHDRKAVGGLDGEQNSGCVGDQTVAGKRFSRWFRYTMDEIGMNLPQGD